MGKSQSLSKKCTLKLKDIKACIKKENPERTWKIGDELGRGSTGTVYAVENRESRLQAAAKVIPAKKNADIVECGLEVYALRQLDHPGIVKLMAALLWNKNLYVILERCDGGALDDVVLDRRKGLSEPQLRSFCAQMVAGLAYMHENGVYHRDVKAGNVLLTAAGMVKITDFNTSSVHNKSTAKSKAAAVGAAPTLLRCQTFIGSPYWMAPEVVACEDNDERNAASKTSYDHRADVWSFGITIIECAEVDPPYRKDGISPMRALLKIVKNPAPSFSDHTWSDDLFSFLEACLQKNEDDRSTATELKSHAFIADYQPDPAVLQQLLPGARDGELLSYTCSSPLLSNKALLPADSMGQSIVLLKSDLFSVCAASPSAADENFSGDFDEADEAPPPDEEGEFGF
eukprot:m.1200198 g.1200198  ORF g.1200198 m.1200198 type:complete len:401 (+) comp24572_c0_seq34:282-1484(+)